jgi:hypothetical protein
LRKKGKIILQQNPQKEKKPQNLRSSMKKSGLKNSTRKTK